MEYRAKRKTIIYQELDNIYEVVSIGRDENQPIEEKDNEIWCNFIFDEIPQPTEELNEWVENNNYQGNLHLINTTNKDIILKTLEQLEVE
jgi:hypothetical protein